MLTPITVIQYIHMHHAIWVTHRLPLPLKRCRCCQTCSRLLIVSSLNPSCLWVIKPCCHMWPFRPHK